MGKLRLRGVACLACMAPPGGFRHPAGSMRIPTDHTFAATRRWWAAAPAALALGLVCLLCAGSNAPAQTLDEELAEKQSQLEQVKESGESLEATIASQNARVDALLGQVAALKAEEAAVERKLAAKQAELDRTEAALAAEREQLERVRDHLQRALAVLRDRVVAIYMSGTPDTLNVVLGSATWSDAITTSEYLAQIRDNDDAIVERVRSLRDETRAAVDRLEDAQERIEAARDAIAAREAELAGSRAAVQASYAELSALKAEREATLDALIDRQEDLESDVSSIAGQIREQQEALADPATSSPEEPLPPPVPGATATLLPDGRAVPPASAPPAVVAAIEAANAISDTPYLWGGGHGSFESSGYDCSGAVSYALHAGGFLSSPLDSTGLAFWGAEGAGSWITVYAASGHAYAVIAGLRWDTSGGAGPRWHADMRSSAGFVARHPSGY